MERAGAWWSPDIVVCPGHPRSGTVKRYTHRMISELPRNRLLGDEQKPKKDRRDDCLVPSSPEAPILHAVVG